MENCSVTKCQSQLLLYFQGPNGSTASGPCDSPAVSTIISSIFDQIQAEIN